MMLLFLKLFLAHILGDFVFQPDSWVRDKTLRKYRSPFLYLHLVVHTLALLLLLEFDTSFFPAIAAIVGTHFLIDVSKLYLQEKLSPRLSFFLDQLAHLLVLLGVVLLYFPDWMIFESFYQPQILLFIISLLLLSVVSAIIMRLLMSRWILEEDRVEDSLTNAGKYIGILERLFVFTFIVLHQWQAIGFLIAAKSILRFSDLSRAKDRKLTEYVLIGTLLSFGLAILVGLLFNAVYPLLKV